MKPAYVHLRVANIDARELISRATFDALWKLRPKEAQKIRIAGKPISIPRRQQAYERDYRFSGQESVAQSAPPVLRPFLAWGRQNVNARLNGLLVNWYDAEFGEYIGAHHDSITGLAAGSPIVTISLGAQRVFRLRENGGKPSCDILVSNGTVLILPWRMNRRWTHEVLRRASDTGHRISVTLRAFAD